MIVCEIKGGAQIYIFGNSYAIPKLEDKMHFSKKEEYNNFYSVAPGYIVSHGKQGKAQYTTGSDSASDQEAFIFR